MGENVGVTYEEVKAYQATNGIDLYFVNSDGQYTTQGILVLWNSTTGFTEKGWDESDNNSPYNFVTRDEWNADIADGNLNTTFAKWTDQETGLSLSERLAWCSKMAEKGCAIET